MDKGNRDRLHCIALPLQIVVPPISSKTKSGIYDENCERHQVKLERDI